MNGESLNVTQDNIEKLKQLFPDLFSENKLDWEKLKAAFSDDINFANERYVLNWAGKADAFKALQIPTTAILKPVPEESINFDITQNIFIEGENLEVLKVLQKSYYNKVKCIIIDPPYNTGSDSFIYPDSFKENKRDYEKRVGDKDEEGYLLKEGLFRKNSKDNGHFHSNWLSMMYPRLFLAKNLLREDGVIFVHIDDNEVHNLRLLMNEIFGEENFINTIIWEKKFSPQNDAKYFSDNHDYILAFSKIKEQFKRNLLPKTEELLNRYSNLDNDYRGEWTSSDCTVKTYSASYDYEIISPSGKSIFPTKGRCWFTSKEKFQELINDNRIWFGKSGDNVPRLKSFLSEVKDGIVPTTIWKHTDVGHNQEAKQEINKLFDGQSPFETPKPTRLIKRIIELSTNNGSEDIILDFFAGSATTAHSVILKNEEDGGNRKFILVQLPELIDEKSEINKLGYKTIADISKERIRRAIKQLESPVKKIETNSKNEKSQLGLDLGSDHLSSTTITTITEITELRFEENNIHAQDLGFKVFKLSPSNFKIWRGDEINEDNLQQQLDAFTNPVSENSQQQNMLYELMVKAGYTLTDKVETKGHCFSINNGALIIVLEEINKIIIDEIILSKPQKVITLDSLFKGNDQLKTNTVLQMRDAGIDFKTI